jgi:ATP-binding cassette subfamily B protein
MRTDAELFILDEPTAALDIRAEYEVYQRFAALRGGTTTLLITHRLASVQMADRILFLEDGHIVEEGNHAYLLHQDGKYAHLFRLQQEQFGVEPYGEGKV